MLRIGQRAAWTALPILAMSMTLGGCAQMSGLGPLATLGGDNGGQAEATATAQPQLVALAPEETPPLPTRRPGKRPRTPQVAASAEPAAPATTASTAPSEGGEQPAKSGGGFSLSALGSMFTSSATTPAPAAEEASKTEAAQPSIPEIVSIDQPPVGAYSVLAQRIKYCWLNATKPLLPNHGFFSELPAGEVREAKMIVYEKNAEGRRGTTVFAVDIAADSGGSTVTSRNVKLDKATEAGFKADMARWVKGDDRCKA